MSKPHYTRTARRSQVEPIPRVNARPQATCHPDRPHAARGLCVSCYNKQRTKRIGTCSNCGRNDIKLGKDLCAACTKRLRSRRPRATCHPGRPAHTNGLCRACSLTPNPGMATCHPDRPHKSHGLCATCYKRKLIHDKPAATCHPDRKAFSLGLCQQCYTKHRNASKPMALCHPNKRAHKDSLCQACYTKRWRYGITPAEYDAIKDRQGGACAICGVIPKLLFIDHSHTKGKVRGLLCHRCNTALGFFGDNITRIRRAIEYLRADGFDLFGCQSEADPGQQLPLFTS